MATLILKWPVTEGTGSTLNESVNGREMYFKTAGSYPAWTTGPTGAAGTAITISGSTDSNAYASTDSPYTCSYTGAAPNYNGITIAARFKLNSDEGGPVISSFYLYEGDRPSAGNPSNILLSDGPYLQIFVTSTGAIGFGWKAARSLTGYRPSIRAGTRLSGEWNVVIARLEAPYAASVYTNGTWYTGNPTYRHDCLTWDSGFTPAIFPADSFYTQFWAIGDCGTAGFCGSPARSFSGSVGECRVYCGQLTDDEIEDLYDELVTPPSRNAIMFSCNT